MGLDWKSVQKAEELRKTVLRLRLLWSEHFLDYVILNQFWHCYDMSSTSGRPITDYTVHKIPPNISYHYSRCWQFQKLSKYTVPDILNSHRSLFLQKRWHANACFTTPLALEHLTSLAALIARTGFGLERVGNWLTQGEACLRWTSFFKLRNGHEDRQERTCLSLNIKANKY